MRFEEAFTLESKRQARSSAKTSGGTITVWSGEVNGQACRIRITPRARVAHHAFLVNANARLPGGEEHRHQLRGGDFLDVQVVEGALDDAALRELARLVDAAEVADTEAGGELRPARVRRKGEKLRGDALGADILIPASGAPLPEPPALAPDLGAVLNPATR